MRRNTDWTIRLLVPGLALGGLILGISAGLDGQGSAEARDRAPMTAAAEFLGYPVGPLHIEEVAARSGSANRAASSTSTSTTSTSSNSSSSSGESSACGPESPCLNGKAVGRVLQKLLQQLDLSSTQTSQINTILQGERAAILKIIAALKSSAGSSPTQQQLEAAKTQINALQLKDRAAIDKILTTDQLTELTALEKQYCACNQAQPNSGGAGSGGKTGGKKGKGSGGKCDGSGGSSSNGSGSSGSGSSGSGSSGSGSSGGNSGETTTATPTPTPSDSTST